MTDEFEVEKKCLKAASTALGNIYMMEDHKELTIRIAKAFIAANKEDKKHDGYIDVHWIVATAVWWASQNFHTDSDAIIDWDAHPYALVARPIIQYATVMYALDALSAAKASLSDLDAYPFDTSQAVEALQILKSK